MVPHSSQQPPTGSRALSPETTVVLQAAILERWRVPGDGVGDAAMADAVGRAAAEARERGMRPEELIVLLKGIEDEVMGRPGLLRATDPDARRRFREWLVSTCVRAYFSD